MLEREIDDRQHTRGRREHDEEGCAEKAERRNAPERPEGCYAERRDERGRRENRPELVGHRPTVVEHERMRPEAQPQVVEDHLGL